MRCRLLLQFQYVRNVFLKERGQYYIDVQLAVTRLSLALQVLFIYTCFRKNEATLYICTIVVLLLMFFTKNEATLYVYMQN